MGVGRGRGDLLIAFLHGNALLKQKSGLKSDPLTLLVNYHLIASAVI